MDPGTRTPLAIAAGAGLIHATTSLYWAGGGTWLIETVGDASARLEASGLTVALALGAAAIAKAALAVAPLRLASSRVPVVRGLLWVLALVLAVYGTVLTIAGLLALTGVFGEVADAVSLAGHALIWDPLFAIWGIALGLGLRRSGRSAVVRRRPAPARLGVAAPALVREATLLAGSGRSGRPPGGWRWGERLAEQRGRAVSSGDAVASLRAVLGGHDDDPLAERRHDPRTLPLGQPVGIGDRHLEFDAAVGRVHALAAGTARPGEPLGQGLLRDGQPVRDAGPRRDDELHHASPGALRRARTASV